jgi:hypothetical protein
VITALRARRGPSESGRVAELKDGALIPAGQVQFGLAPKAVRRLDPLRDGPSNRSG